MKVISYNILAQRYIKEFPSVSDNSVLKWEYRLDLILNKLSVQNADIILLQEVELESFDKDFIKLFADYSFFRHVVDKKRNNPIGNVTLWKNNMIAEKKISTSCSLIVEFDKFFVVNIHLKAKILKGESQRQTQIRSVLKKLNNQKPGFVAGDFNDYLNTECLYDVKTEGLVMAEISKYKLDVYSNPNSTYVYNKKFSSDNYWTFDHVISNIAIELRTEKKDNIPFPNESEPSDHLMFVFDVCI